MSHRLLAFEVDWPKMATAGYGCYGGRVHTSVVVNAVHAVSSVLSGWLLVFDASCASLTALQPPTKSKSWLGGLGTFSPLGPYNQLPALVGGYVVDKVDGIRGIICFVAFGRNCTRVNFISSKQFQAVRQCGCSS